jgi:hypothetical protein
LTRTGLLIEGDYTQSRSMSAIGMLHQLRARAALQISDYRVPPRVNDFAK